MKNSIFLVLVPVLVAFDYTEEVKKYIDPDVDPCDNFYRHVCRMDTPGFLPEIIVQKIYDENRREAELNPRMLSEFQELENDIRIQQKQSIVEKMSKVIGAVYKTICDNNQDTLPFLSEIEKTFFGKCFGPFCFTHLAKDPNCERIAQHIQDVFVYLKHKTGYELDTMTAVRLFNPALQVVRRIDSHWAKTELSREHELQEYFKEMKNVAADLIVETPWVMNNNVSELISSVLDRLYVINALETIKSLPLQLLKESNTLYTDCKNRYANLTYEMIAPYCLLLASQQAEPDSELIKMEIEEDIEKNFYAAETLYPQIKIGYIWYQMFLNTGNRAARLGAPGFVIAHELSHALIKGMEGDILSYFSEEAKGCIQEQYKASCKIFDEGDCSISEEQFEENGADVFAVQVIWKLFENEFLDGKQDFTELESSTELRDLFYAMGSNLCFGGKQAVRGSDPHSPSNVRINALVNHPAFQKAFQCSDDSRMMQSKTKQCSVYGEHAPPNRRRFHLRNV